MAAFKKLILIQLLAWLVLVSAGSYFISQNFDNAIGNAQKMHKRPLSNTLKISLRQIYQQKILQYHKDSV